MKDVEEMGLFSRLVVWSMKEMCSSTWESDVKALRVVLLIVYSLQIDLLFIVLLP
jgi:hypothetical protein